MQKHHTVTSDKIRFTFKSYNCQQNYTSGPGGFGFRLRRGFGPPPSIFNPPQTRDGAIHLLKILPKTMACIPRGPCFFLRTCTGVLSVPVHVQKNKTSECLKLEDSTTPRLISFVGHSLRSIAKFTCSSNSRG